MGGLLFIFGVILLFIGGIMLLIDAFGESLLWGLGCFLLPLPVAALFVITHWHQAKKSVYMLSAGGLLLTLAHYSGSQ